MIDETKPPSVLALDGIRLAIRKLPRVVSVNVIDGDVEAIMDGGFVTSPMEVTILDTLSAASSAMEIESQTVTHCLGDFLVGDYYKDYTYRGQRLVFVKDTKAGSVLRNDMWRYCFTDDDGEPVLVRESEVPQFNIRPVATQTCEDCKGSGKYVGFLDKGDCKTCNGSGSVQAPSSDDPVPTWNTAGWRRVPDQKPVK